MCFLMQISNALPQSHCTLTVGGDVGRRSTLLDGNFKDAGEQKPIKNNILNLLTAVSKLES